MECQILLSTGVRPFLARWNSNKGLKKLVRLNQASIRENAANKISWKLRCTPASLEEEFSALQSQEFTEDDETDVEDLSDEASSKPLSSEELKALLLDSERSKIIKKLSDANQYNRVLKRQLQSKEDSLVNFKSELAVLELEIQALVSLAEEIANYEIPEGSRKIRGRYIQSHLLSRLEAVQEKLREQTKDVDAAQSKEVPLYWYGVAESVQVMGSFDGWSQGEHLSPEYTGSYTKFSTTLMLRPGRYEIKFLVDGEWNLSPEFPTIGEGLMQNNLLIVE
ncbi:protein PTST, chloroplastic [Coffea eugenioides]|uniref:protein PTST, chloroplastic n=1 Tax=Coffea eugenioides TaxID=49369 RepID=UPI000F60CAB0|nr:protein PTST, chloroplastic [Coffea eugenioides]XP_027160109.1 protein PTST, chloroplastic [Coffea eugenioides]XP_027160110.1 protein PTST, chloroplastic [Coffea eugenioides]XP_027160111.1 protein PTST, chloroplastic [Coffea eugenioides]XP_027160112.1 protein PTST, chloroplastic [Coffea eugenioides]